MPFDGDLGGTASGNPDTASGVILMPLKQLVAVIHQSQLWLKSRKRCLIPTHSLKVQETCRSMMEVRCQRRKESPPDVRFHVDVERRCRGEFAVISKGPPRILIESQWVKTCVAEACESEPHRVAYRRISGPSSSYLEYVVWHGVTGQRMTECRVSLAMFAQSVPTSAGRLGDAMRSHSCDRFCGVWGVHVRGIRHDRLVLTRSRLRT